MTKIEIDQVRQRTNQYLQAMLASKISQADRLDPSYGQLWRSIDQLVSAGGKRLRPYLVHWSYRAFGGQPTESIIKAGVAIELLHVSLLIHDDIIDRDTLRYGIKNISGQYRDTYQADLEASQVDHFADSAALMAGNLLLAEAHRLLAEADPSPAVRDCFATAVFAVCGGELLDTEAAFRGRVAPALTIAEVKTASYSFEAPLAIGALMAGADERSVAGLRQLAKAWGVAYQLKDDLLGVFGNPAVTGKSATSDIEEGKRTYLIEQFDSLASPDQHRQMDQVFGVGGRQPADYQLAIDLLESSGARRAVEDKIDQLRTTINQQVDSLPIDDSYRQALGELVKASLQRQN